MEFDFGDIQGVKIEQRAKIPDERGTILHGVRAEQLHNTFGEVYFKKLYKGCLLYTSPSPRD